MQMKTLFPAIAIMFLAFELPVLAAQEIVHAMAGTIAGTGPTATSLTIRTPDQAAEVFQVKQISGSVSLDKTLKEKSETVDKLSKGKSNVIVYYFGYPTETVVAVKDLGSEVKSLSGTINQIDKGQHTITIHPASGSDEVCVVMPETTVETSNGVVDGSKLPLKKGDKVSVVSKASAGEGVNLIV